MKQILDDTKIQPCNQSEIYIYIVDDIKNTLIYKIKYNTQHISLSKYKLILKFSLSTKKNKNWMLD